jgi:hypothetical protein
MDSTEHNSITVAAAGIPASGSNSSSVHSSPSGLPRIADEGARPQAAAHGATNMNNRNNDSDGETAPAASTVARQAVQDYEYADNLDEITVRQLEEDIRAYSYDLDYCRAQLQEADLTLTPQETRTLQLRILDLGHQIRHCRHRIELARAQARKSSAPGWSLPIHRHQREIGSGLGPIPRTTNGLPSSTISKHPRNPSGSGLGAGTGSIMPPSKRVTSGSKRPSLPDPSDDEETEKETNHKAHDAASASASASAAAKRPKLTAPSPSDSDTVMAGGGMDDEVNTTLQRLGFWKCRLCSAPKYLLAGSGRSPAAPCKWPLKDISKMITHFTEMHAEHTPAERCAELGAALSHNRAYPSPSTSKLCHATDL